MCVLVIAADRGGSEEVDDHRQFSGFGHNHERYSSRPLPVGHEASTRKRNGTYSNPQSALRVLLK